MCNDRGAMEECCKGKMLLFVKVSLKNSQVFFKNLLVPTLITMFYGVAFKIRFLLSMVSSMFETHTMAKY
jgi:hypothetical protein